jgi:hypothetical protein
MWTQTYLTRLVVGVGCPSADMIFGDSKLVEALLYLD